jgi:hypothetical protein
MDVQSRLGDDNGHSLVANGHPGLGLIINTHSARIGGRAEGGQQDRCTKRGNSGRFFPPALCFDRASLHHMFLNFFHIKTKGIELQTIRGTNKPKLALEKIKWAIGFFL